MYTQTWIHKYINTYRSHICSATEWPFCRCMTYGLITGTTWVMHRHTYQDARFESKEDLRCCCCACATCCCCSAWGCSCCCGPAGILGCCWDCQSAGAGTFEGCCVCVCVCVCACVCEYALVPAEASNPIFYQKSAHMRECCARTRTVYSGLMHQDEGSNCLLLCAPYHTYAHTCKRLQIPSCPTLALLCYKYPCQCIIMYA
jgi:hypothetical protein